MAGVDRYPEKSPLTPLYQRGGLDALVLAGGRSQRFGTDKALAMWRGRPLLAWVVERLQATHDRVWIAGAPERYAAFGVPVVPDVEAFAGPLAAVHGSWMQTNATAICVVACDMPWISPAMLALLWQQSDHGRRAVVLETPDGPSPLPAIYPRASATVSAAALAQGRRDLRAIAVGMPTTVVIPEAEWRRIDSVGAVLWNVNTREALLAHENLLSTAVT